MKKKLLISLSVILVIVLLISAAFFTFLGILSYNGLGIMKGYYVTGRDNIPVITDLKGTNIEIFDGSEDGTLLDDLEDGDCILILHGGIMETYPPRTAVYGVKIITEQAFVTCYNMSI